MNDSLNLRLKLKSWTKWKSSQNKKSISYKWFTIQLNVIASILELLKIFSEITVVSTKCGPQARIENLIMSTGPNETFL